MVLLEGADARDMSGSNGFDSSDEENEVQVQASPFHIDWLDLSNYGCTEQLGISALPGCRFKDTWRNLKADLAVITAEEIREVFVLCTRGELSKYRVPWLLTEYTSADVTVHHYPFPDGNVPSMGSLLKMCEEIKQNLVAGSKTLLHCYGGLGRSGLVGVCLLMLLDPTLEADVAIQKIQHLRGPSAIQSVKQYNFIHEFRDKLVEYEKENEGTSRSVSR